jgi:hypothetical protein
MCPMHFPVHLADLLDKPLAIISIINQQMIFLGPLLLLQRLQIAMPTIPVDMPSCSQVINDSIELPTLAALWGLRLLLL